MNTVFRNAKWIQGGKNCESPQFRCEFNVKDPISAMIRICGLGFFELYLNGEKVSRDTLVPAWSDYEERPGRRMLYPINDTFKHRAYYLEYNILPYIQKGVNVIGVWLGNGWYNQHERNVEGDFAYGFPKLCFLAEWEERGGLSGSIVSDESFLWRESEIILNNIFYGETHDLKATYDGWNIHGGGSGWKPVTAVEAPETDFYLQQCPADRVIRRIQPVMIFKDEKRRVYDCMENITGYAVIKCPAMPECKVKVTYSENFDNKTQILDYSSTGVYDQSRQIQTDRYLCGESERICHPRFCWHAFRYFEISGCEQAEAVEVRVVHADIPVISSFECSDDTLNWLYQAYIRTQLGNIHCAVPSDCPHRERLGYTGDGQISSKAAMFCLDVRSLYEKWMADIADGQDRTTGHVQHTAPFYGGGGGPGGWGSAVYIIPWNYYKHYGDETLLRQYLPNMMLWLDYMDSRAPNGLVISEEKDGWCLGEWYAPDQTIPEPFVNTYFYIKGLHTVLEISEIIETQIDGDLLRRRLKKAMNAINKTYYNPDTGSYCSGVNGADAFMVDLTMGDDRTLNNLIERYRKYKKIDTGFIGTSILIDTLFKHDPDSAMTLLTGYTEYSFERMRRAGATTIWETWDGSSSHNHPALGAVVCSLFTHILGIKQTEGEAGFQNAIIAPAKFIGLKWAKGSIMTISGKISIKVDRDIDGNATTKVSYT